MVAPYRNDHDALMARLVGLIDELASIRSRASALRDLERTEQDVEREIANVRRTVARVAPTRLPLLERVSIAAPCSAEWSSMTGDERTRFCAQCQKHVYNIASMSAEEAEAFLRGAGGEACLRIYRRTDGTVLTSDCSVGVRRRSRRRVVGSLVGGSLVSAGVLLTLEKPPPPAPIVARMASLPTPTEATAVPSVEPTTSPVATAAPTVPSFPHTAGKPSRITPEMQLDAELSHVRSLLDQRAGITDPVKRRGVEVELRAASQRVIQLSPPRVDPKAP
jgi:hypothetical protein